MPGVARFASGTRGAHRKKPTQPRTRRGDLV